MGIRLGLSRDCNLNATALGLRLLRLRRYDVSPGIFINNAIPAFILRYTLKACCMLLSEPAIIYLHFP